MNHDLIKPVTNEEIRRAAFDIKGSSTLGYDGMYGQFYQAYWYRVGDQVIKDVNSFFEFGYFPPECNFTQISLLSNKISDIHHIS